MATPQVEYSLLYITRNRLTCLKVSVTGHILSQMNIVCTSRPYFFKISFNVILQIFHGHIFLCCTIYIYIYTRRYMSYFGYVFRSSMVKSAYLTSLENSLGWGKEYCCLFVGHEGVWENT
jgi:hypothetical protein